MRNQKKLLLSQLDQRMKPFRALLKIQVPEKGWINNIRTSLNMNLEQLGNRLNMTKQGVKKVEEREAAETISIKSLKEVGKALDLQFVYGFVPIQGSIADLIEHRAQNLARKIVLRTNQNMKLENQGNDEKRLNEAIKELTLKLKSTMHKSLWD